MMMKPLQILMPLILIGASPMKAQEVDPFAPASLVKEISLNSKLKEIIIPKVEFTEIPLYIALDFLRTRSVELDLSTADPAKKGVNLILHDQKTGDTALTLKAEKVPLGEAIKLVASLAGLEMVVQENVVVVAPPGAVKQVKTPQMVKEEDVAAAALRAKLIAITIPSIEFVDTPFPEAIGFLAQKSFELDSEKDENKKGANFTLAGGKPAPETQITLTLNNVSLFDALHNTCNLAAMKFKLESDVVVISAVGEE